MPKSIQSVRGMHDVLPADSPQWQTFESAVARIMKQYGYSEIRTPVVESTDLFCRSIGEITDIVEKEMYTFEDRNGDMLTLRPEGTASCVRAGIQHGILHNQIQRLWYLGPMFRHERPQKGRYRQFHQFGVEVFGIADADIDAELILMTARLWRALGLKDIELQLNTLGNNEVRQQYRTVLVEYFSKYKEKLDQDSLRRLDSNPLRILDSKNPELAEIIADAPSMLHYLDEESEQHFSRLCSILEAAGVSYTVNPRLVRGLDYYCKTVFEWVTTSLGAQGTVCAGGRYDGLVEQLGGRATPAAGFAMGIERLLALMQEQRADLGVQDIDIYFIMQGEQAGQTGLLLAESLRDAVPELQLLSNCGGGSFKSQMKKADKSGARFALILGESELAENTVAIKPLRTDAVQMTIAQDNLIEHITGLL